MAKWTISKFFSLVVFLTMMVLFFLWITSQVNDLGLFFGFRTSHTVSNDIANVITSIGGVPGEASVIYEIDQSSTDQGRFKYNIDISNKIVCVTSFLVRESSSTTDCVSHPYELEYKITENIECVKLNFTKSIEESGSSLTVQELSTTCPR